MPRIVTFHVCPAPPKGDRVLIDVTEGRKAAGQFELSAAGWRKVRERLTPGPGLRIVDCPTYR
jgi:hypothetical protein